MEGTTSGGTLTHVGTEPCLPPSLGRFPSEDIDSPQELAAYETMTKALDDRQQAKEISNRRDSLSDFEFAAISAVQNESAHGKHMLPADELFFKGKLLPLYNPVYKDGYARQATMHDMHITMHTMQDHISRHVFLDRPTLNCPLYRADSENLQANMADLTVPISPKVPKCSAMLKELFRWKKMAKSICACAASREVAAGSFRKSSKSASKKGKAGKGKQKTSLMLQASAPASSFCMARGHLPYPSTDADSSGASPPKNSISEPLLTCCVAQLGYPPVSSEQNHHYQNLHNSDTVLLPAYADAFNKASRVRESLCTHKPSHDEGKTGINHRSQAELPDRRSRSSILQPVRAHWGKPTVARRSCDGTRMYEEDFEGRSTGLNDGRPSMQMLWGKPNPHRMSRSLSSHEGSRCSILMGDLNSGSRRPGHMTADWGGSSLAGMPCQYEDNAGAALVTEEATVGSTRPRRGGETSPEKSSCGAPNASGSRRPYATEMEGEMLKSPELSQTKNVERSSSYSPKSLQRKYEHLKAVRQRDLGWRILERSSSYSSGMHSVRVAPVLNVPVIVCMSRSKSSNHVMHTRRKS